MAEKYEVPLKNEQGDVIGTARIDPDEFPGGVVEVTVTDENMKRQLRQPLMNDINLSIWVPPEQRTRTELFNTAEAHIIKHHNKEKNDG